MTSVNDIRATFLNFFDRNDHQVVQSSPLVPRNDPTLMFVNSGMVQFKNLFTGQETRDYVRATSAQKCVRAGGKHNDLDNVGYTARHHTFFEMMGNFSFGDYFKEQAITQAWDLITKDFAIDKDRLYVTVYHTDDEAADIWKKYAGLPDDRIIRIDTDDNFWKMGPTGPCGPCTEIFYDHGDHIWGGPPGSPEEDGDRFIEIWNLVFMQNEQFEDGSMVPLDMQSIDTGMGIERVAALLQGSHDNYQTDLFKDLIEASAHATGVDPYGDMNVSHRVIADHLRSTSFLIADGVLPSNEGRGYVLRRIMRRAMRHAHLLGAQDPVMHKLVPALVKQMGQAYPELTQGQAMIEETLLLEETRFKKTLDRGLKLLDDEVSGLGEGGTLAGDTAFKLYDTYGFPVDLTQDALREKGMTVDVDGFNAAMEEQKAKARAAWSGSGEAADESIWFDIAEDKGVTEFLGYDTETAEGQVVAVVVDGALADSADKGTAVQVVLNQTPFYAESGGQIGDSGVLKTDGATVTVSDVKKKAGVFIHIGEVSEGTLTKGAAAELTVDHGRRSAIRNSHSATHLLNEALRNALGDNVAQRGSLNAVDRLRFDFSYSKAMTADEIKAVEAEVNAYIRQNSSVETRIMTPDDARELGAQALFGEKYGDEVRVVSMGVQGGSGKGLDKNTYSLELCGGTHVSQLGQIGLFALLSESASSNGVRRIEALTGQEALKHLTGQSAALAGVAGTLKAKPEDVSVRVQALLDERKALQNEVAELRKAVAMGGGGQSAEAEDVNGVPFFAQVLKDVPGKDLRGLIDEHKNRLGSAVILLISDAGGKAAVAAGVTDDLTSKVSAVDVVKAAAAELGGKGGGGRPDMAQAGGADAANADKAVAVAKTVLGA
ncbi:alanine--tRNA ligase [Amylibacter sp. SFDW26]|uniref:alanine--tRNA ligase n=1 Tax=Amylibacter sp. SFDW26 TaxID=2652722 RepID=UPI0012627D9E|nr:alanine--tRNA ligase [Amylibacter sp. SFDW26]KAB7615654.1 alanine--tRNA ligase [Amylibacter sp. SFDW26]